MVTVNRTIQDSFSKSDKKATGYILGIISSNTSLYSIHSLTSLGGKPCIRSRSNIVNRSYSLLKTLSPPFAHATISLPSNSLICQDIQCCIQEGLVRKRFLVKKNPYSKYIMKACDSNPIHNSNQGMDQNKIQESNLEANQESDMVQEWNKTDIANGIIDQNLNQKTIQGTSQKTNLDDIIKTISIHQSSQSTLEKLMLQWKEDYYVNHPHDQFSTSSNSLPRNVSEEQLKQTVYQICDRNYQTLCEMINYKDARKNLANSNISNRFISAAEKKTTSTCASKLEESQEEISHLIDSSRQLHIFKQIYHLVRLSLQRSIPSTSIYKYILIYLNEHFWKKFNKTMRNKFTREILQSEQFLNSDHKILMIKKWAQENKVQYAHVYRFYHYKMKQSSNHLKNTDLVTNANSSFSTSNIVTNVKYLYESSTSMKSTPPNIREAKKPSNTASRSEINFLKHIIDHFPEEVFRSRSGKLSSIQLSESLKDFFLKELKWTSKQLNRRVTYYADEKGRITPTKTRLLLKWMKKNYDSMDELDFSDLQLQLQLSKEQIYSLIRRLSSPRKLATNKIREKIRQAYEMHKDKYPSNVQSSKFPSLNSLIVEDLSLSLKLPRFIVRNEIERHLSTSLATPFTHVDERLDKHDSRNNESSQQIGDWTLESSMNNHINSLLAENENCQSNQKRRRLTISQRQAIADFFKEENIEIGQTSHSNHTRYSNTRQIHVHLNAEQIERLMEKANISRRQVYYILDVLAHPPGEWTKSKRAFVDDILIKESYAPFREIGHYFDEFIQNSNLSRKQVRDYVNYKRRKRGTM